MLATALPRHLGPAAPCRRGRPTFVRPLVELLEDRRLLTNFPVLNTNDSGADSLRQAILDANANAGPDVITFAIGAAGSQQTISVGSTTAQALPTITDQVTIDGWSQGGAGYTGPPLIEIEGTSAGAFANGLSIFPFGQTGSPNGSIVQGLVINRFSRNGIDIGFGVSGVLIQGNYIGTNVAGTAAQGNGGDGVRIEDASSNTVGGTTAAARNLISGNTGHGVHILNVEGSGATLNVVQGNFIGTDVGGTLGLGNTGAGVLLDADNTLVGGSAPGTGNTIAFNGGAGVAVDSGTGNTISRNSIFSNTGLGIDLASDGVTANDTGDSDSGPNNLQNFPVLTAASSAGGSTTIQGTFHSTPSATFTLEFFSNAAGDPSGFGEGKTFLGAMPVTTDSSGNASFSFTFPGVNLGERFLTATATASDGSTSEFSAGVLRTDPPPVVPVVPVAPVVPVVVPTLLGRIPLFFDDRDLLGTIPLPGQKAQRQPRRQRHRQRTHAPRPHPHRPGER